MADEDGFVKQSPFNKQNLTMFLNDKQNRHVLMAGLLLTWCLSNLIIYVQRYRFDMDISDQCRERYCEILIAGYTVLTISIFFGFPIIYYYDIMPNIVKWFILILLITGSFIIMGGTFDSLDDICREDNNDNINNNCNAGAVGPAFMASMFTIFFGVDIVWELCNDVRIRSLVFLNVYLLFCIGIYYGILLN